MKEKIEHLQRTAQLSVSHAHELLSHQRVEADRYENLARNEEQATQERIQHNERLEKARAERLSKARAERLTTATATTTTTL